MSTRNFATFFINTQLFGLDILQIREINKHLDLTNVPLSVDCIRGLINLRGQIVTVLDLKSRLGLGQCVLTEDTHNIILKTDGELANLHLAENPELETGNTDKVGLLVEGIGDVITVDSGEIDPPPANLASIDKKYIAGVVKLQGELLTIINLQSVLKGVV